MSVEILPTATQQCRNYLYTTSPEEIEVMKLEGYIGAMRNKHVHSALNHDAIESLPLSYWCHKQADYGRVVDITYIGLSIGSIKSQKKKKWISDATYAAIREKREAKGEDKKRYQELK